MSEIPPSQQEFQQKFNATWREAVSADAQPICWVLTPQSELLLSPLLALPISRNRLSSLPSPHWSVSQPLHSTRFPSCACNLVANDVLIDSVQCVNVNGYAVVSEAPSTPQRSPPAVDEVTELNEKCVLKKKGPRVIVAKSDYFKEKQEELQQPKKDVEVETMTISSLRVIDASFVNSLIASPFFLLFGRSSSFIHLMRSLLLTRKAAVVSLSSSSPLLLPLTTTSAFLFFLHESPPFALRGMVERDCADLLQASNTDAFLVWHHVLEGCCGRVG